MHVNYLAVLIAAVAGFAFGAAYYMALGKRWMEALGKTEAECKAVGMAGPMLVSAVAQFVMAYLLAGLLVHIAGGMTLKGGLLTGFFLWLGFSLTVIAVNYAWQGVRRMLTVIDGLHWLGVLLIQGAILGGMGA